MSGPVTVGIDDFDHCDQLLSVAAHEARWRRTRLRLVHAYHGFGPVIPGLPPDFTPEKALRDTAMARLGAAAKHVEETYPGLEVETVASAGPAADVLTQIGPTGLLVVGGRGRGGFTGQVLGSVPPRVLARAACPVLVVRGEAGPQTHHVMIGLDLDEPDSSPALLDFAFDEAARRGADVYAFNAWEDPVYLYLTIGDDLRGGRLAGFADRSRRLEEALAPWKEKYPDIALHGQVLAGSPSRLLVESTRIVDLLVIGGRTREKGHAGMRIGGLAHTVLHHARCPVAVVPEP